MLLFAHAIFVVLVLITPLMTETMRQKRNGNLSNCGRIQFAPFFLSLAAILLRARLIEIEVSWWLEFQYQLRTNRHDAANLMHRHPVRVGFCEWVSLIHTLPHTVHVHMQLPLIHTDDKHRMRWNKANWSIAPNATENLGAGQKFNWILNDTSGQLLICLCASKSHLNGQLATGWNETRVPMGYGLFTFRLRHGSNSYFTQLIRDDICWTHTAKKMAGHKKKWLTS